MLSRAAQSTAVQRLRQAQVLHTVKGSHRGTHDHFLEEQVLAGGGACCMFKAGR